MIDGACLLGQYLEKYASPVSKDAPMDPACKEALLTHICTGYVSSCDR